ncbi:uncharacterized protein EDB93DRAFT_1245821 [Suillus bovinus]|uniref:uncharacterized protein n=1 Tax=Suillus bovinus TaxID=48563 RepID=UPI001B861AA4|nr:uncharacterized protein EDB93DRAFT_1245821 [Suillus bovinus]KAG2158591.1 hypothetical protein EDB93DRAFT_1245821 [Suillus bovinus]
MAYHPSSFRSGVAGQLDSSHPHLISQIPLRDKSGLRSKPMYEDMKNIQYWMTGVKSEEKPNIDSKVPSSPDGIYAHPFNFISHRGPCDLQDDDYESSDDHDGLMTFDISPWLAHHMRSLSDSSDDTATSTTVPDNEATTQHININWDSPWYRPPETSSPIPSSPLSDSYSCACSQDVRQAMAQQELLLDFFHEELRRIIPSAYNYNSTWLEDVDADLVLSPVRSYEELCWQSAVSDHKPRPGVPVELWD